MLRRFSSRFSLTRRYFFMKSRCDSNTTVDNQELKSAGIIVIGDEILKGQVLDTNSHFIVKNMFKLGVTVQKITVVGDIEDTIAKEVKAFSKEYTYVITTGGIGPTHDDITYQAVAKAFDEPLVAHPELIKLISDYYKTDDLSSAAMKMAHVPKSAKITYGYDKIKGRRTLFPNVSMKNVYMFPGIPQLMENLFLLLCEDLFGGGSRQFFMKELYVNVTESQFVRTLNAIVEEFPKVKFGSYPKLYNRYYKAMITVESEDQEEMNRAYNRLKEALYKDVVLYDKAPLENTHEKIFKLVDRSHNSVIKRAIDLVEECLQKYSSDEIFIYFDGGIETVCMLHIYYALLLRKEAVPKIQAFCIKPSQKDEELETFINETISRYNLKCDVTECQESSTFRLLSDQHPHLKVMIVGNVTTQTEQINECLKVFGENTKRSNIRWIMPLMEWKLDDFQKFVKLLTLPYYDGHTSSRRIGVLLQAVDQMNKANQERNVKTK